MTRWRTKTCSLFCVLLLTLFSSCVSRPTRDETTARSGSVGTSSPSAANSGSETPSSPEGSTPYGSEAAAPSAPTGRELRGPVTLVLGGAGVASFAAVGILKKFQEDGVKIESIIATGWPAVFAVGYGMMKSVHDLEWFAMRLEPSDFASGGLFGTDKGFSDHDRIRSTLSKAFGNQSLNQTRVPIVLSASNSSTGQPEVFSSGNWVDPLSKAISVPGTFRPFPDGPGLGWVSALSGVDVEEAHRRGARSIAAFSMYDDFLVSLQDNRSADAETLFRNLFSAQLSKNVRASLKKASGAAAVRLGRSPHDFASKRLAIQTGYQEATKMLRLLAGKGS